MRRFIKRHHARIGSQCIANLQFGQQFFLARRRSADFRHHNPAATFATRMASGIDIPLATPAANVAATVSPAPDTSKISRATAGSETAASFGRTSIMPKRAARHQNRADFVLLDQPQRRRLHFRIGRKRASSSPQPAPARFGFTKEAP